MALLFFKEDSIGIENNPAVIVQTSTTAPAGFTQYSDIVNIEKYGFHISGYDYKVIRDVLRDEVASRGSGSVEAGFNTLTAVEKQAVAKHNIGTGTQIKDTITDTSERDQYSIDYLVKMKGYSSGVRAWRSICLEAASWSRCKYLSVTIPPSGPIMTVPEFIYSLITISDPNPAAGELSGNLLLFYEDAGIVGFAGGDMSLGILDFVNSTPTTRYETTGLATHPLLSSLVPDGFSDM
jgi:hypothetical protein